MFTQAARPAPTRSCASAAASNVFGSVVTAITSSLMSLFSLVQHLRNLIQPPAMSRRLHTVQEQRDRRRRLQTWGLSPGLAVLLVNAIIGENGYLATAAREERASKPSARRSTGSATRTSGCSTTAAAWNTTPRRSKKPRADRLNLLKPGETLVIIKDVPSPSAPTGSR